MISIIDFEKVLIITEEEAIKLGLKYTSDKKIGYQNDELQLMTASYDCYKEDCIEKEGKYYKNQDNLDKNDEITSYYLYTKYTGDINYVSVAANNHLVNLAEFAPKCKHKFFIKESILSEEPSIGNINSILYQIEEKSSSLNKLVDKIKETTFNSKTNVHVGGGLITTYNDLLLKENICTDILQTELNNGWRIIAVCVQPNQRRPDYVLGRFNPMLAVADKPDAGR